MEKYDEELLENLGNYEKGRIIVKYRSNIENIIDGIVSMSGIALFVLLLILSGNYTNIVVNYLLLSVFIFVISLILKFNIKSYWIFEVFSRKIIFSRYFFGRESKKVIGKFSDILEVGVNSTIRFELQKPRRSKEIEYYQYWVELLLESGKVLRISDIIEDYEGGERKIINLARKVADYFGVKYVPPEFKKRIVPRKNMKTGKYEYIYKEYIIKNIIIAIFFIVVISFLMAVAYVMKEVQGK